MLFEPRLGGAVTEVARDGARMPWGSITDGSPPDGFAIRWFPGLDPAEATLLRVRFVAVDCGTKICVHHSGRASHCGAARGAALLLGDGQPTLAAERAIETSVEIAAPLDPAWEAWTAREGITRFFAPTLTTASDSKPWA